MNRIKWGTIQVKVFTIYSSPNITRRTEISENDKVDWLWVLIVIGIIVVVSCFSSCLLYCKRRGESFNNIITFHLKIFNIQHIFCSARNYQLRKRHWYNMKNILNQLEEKKITYCKINKYRYLIWRYIIVKV